MTISDYKEYIFFEIYSEIYKDINLTFNQLEKLYLDNIIRLFKLKKKQKFIYQIAKLCDEGICQLTDSYWLDNFKAKYSKPKLHHDYIDHFNWGDISGIDGSHILTIDKFKIEVKVYESCCFIFQFNENNIESRQKFIELFKNDIYDEYIKLIIQKRIEQIHENETNALLKINENIINNLK